ncbi:MAG: bifunctional phosphoribosyl-AMP cyclohydrolase/phosphoribosyl-ATP diphosphatase HisIE [Pyrinomonadaceae bacterium]|nr:bifunctional phosphoribosyl-AMP cyclohydrolase/phosphoribosyl-ATP diphosphatase HisIE [Pyrinomonadaceae bacterium]
MNLDFSKYADGLVPAIVQDVDSGAVLMLGFMNAEALEKTLSTRRVTFYSRSKRRLWTKGESSGNFLLLASITADCDLDTLLIRSKATGPICHTGAFTCFGETQKKPDDFLSELESVIEQRRSDRNDVSYVSQLAEKGLKKIAQKVGEEAVETVIAAMEDDTEAFKNEAADLLFHFLVLLQAKNIKLDDVIGVLKNRRR